MRLTGKDLPTLLHPSAEPAAPPFGPSRYRAPHSRPRGFRFESRCPVELRATVRARAPRCPGVYAMLGAKNKIIYVGKAKNLRARLLSYFRDSSDPKAGKILNHTRALVWECAADELSALLRELELIRRFRPRYNVLGQPGRLRYSYLCLGRGPAAYAYSTNEPTGKLVACYGPFVGRKRSALAVRWLNHYFGLRDCPGTVRMSFADQRTLFETDEPAAKCLRYELGTCLAPCAARCDSRAYAHAVRNAKAFLDGRDRAPLDDLSRRMYAAAAEQRYEQAGILKDRLHEMTWLEEKLTFLRTARRNGSFVYPLEGANGRIMWYLLHAGEVQGVVRAPRCERTAAIAARAVRTVFGGPLDADDRCGDSVLIVSRWFKQNAGEHAKLMEPGEALLACEGF